MAANRKIICVAGTRPEVVKMAPVYHALRAEPDAVDVQFVSTAQHRQMLDQMLSVFGIGPDHDFDLMRDGQTLSDVTCAVLYALDDYLAVSRPDLVRAQGDTTTVMATAMACFHRRIPFGHVEAGLRTHDLHRPFPEEFNRRVAGVVADYHFAPTGRSAENMAREQVDRSRIYVTGNTVIDAMRYIFANTRSPRSLVPEGAPYVFMTCHRREIFGEKIREVFHAVREIAERYPELYIWYPVHPNPEVQKSAEEILAEHPRILLCAPLDYVCCLYAMQGATLILSDSGGVQEEAPYLGVPLLVLRDVTERPEGVDAGNSLLVGPHRDAMLEAVERLLTDSSVHEGMSQTASPYGDGRAAQRICDILTGREWEPWDG